MESLLQNEELNATMTTTPGAAENPEKDQISSAKAFKTDEAATPSKMKVVEKLLTKRSYNMFRAGDLAFTMKNRPSKDQSLEALGEALINRRHKVYVPDDFDIALYDKEQLDKQMLLEIMEIRLTEEEEKAGQYNRKVTRT